MGSEGTPVLDLLGHHPPPVDLPDAGGNARLALPDRLDSVRRARDFTRTTLQEWRLAQRFDTVALVVSELVTNALRHGLPGCAAGVGAAGVGAAGRETPRPLVELGLTRCSRRLVCTVRDPGEAAPRITPLAAEGNCLEAESGRGLHLVACCSDDWGWRPLTGSGRGKIVWAIFRLR